MPFNTGQVAQLLAACHRRCCICHRFCGVKMEVHHIEPVGDDGPDTIANAIPVCFECHAEIQLYNDRHPRGRKFRPDELLLHKEQWLRICRETPGVLLTPSRAQDAGPIQALLDELEFNVVLAERTDPHTIGAHFLVGQFERAIEEGAFSLLSDSVRSGIAAAYATLMRANTLLTTLASTELGTISWRHALAEAQRTIGSVRKELPGVHDSLLAQLGHSPNDA
jgi:hypothetical protein